MIKLDDWMTEGLYLTPDTIDDILSRRMLKKPLRVEHIEKVKDKYLLNEICRMNNYLRIEGPICIQ